jgi:hypothetical protein
VETVYFRCTVSHGLSNHLKIKESFEKPISQSSSSSNSYRSPPDYYITAPTLSAPAYNNNNNSWLDSELPVNAFAGLSLGGPTTASARQTTNNMNPLTQYPKRSRSSSHSSMFPYISIDEEKGENYGAGAGGSGSKLDSPPESLGSFGSLEDFMKF